MNHKMSLDNITPSASHGLLNSKLLAPTTTTAVNSHNVSAAFKSPVTRTSTF